MICDLNMVMSVKALIVFILFKLSCLATGASVQLGGIVEKSSMVVTDCRYSDTHMSLCVEPAIAYINDTNFCESHMCGPSYIPAEHCAKKEDERAKFKCMVNYVPKYIWKCEPNSEHVNIKLPEDCTDNCVMTHVCPCFMEHKDQKILSYLYPVVPCNTR